MPLSVMNTNKKRIYVAFYTRLRSSGDTDLFHDGIVLLPKPGQTDQAWRFHAINNRPVVVDGKQTLVWQFEPLQIRNRTVQLKALLYLGKLSNNISVETLTAILGEIPVVQGNPDWKCHTWTTAAIRKLQDYGILEIQGVAAEQILEAGTSFATLAEVDFQKPVPTCNCQGEEIESGIPDKL
ncbi:hypothetical protein BDP27DRAFT_1349121 [Rhodocollybia butyracea]|uniref:Uncharacterized protein n=1 Tax=Rhodocollybia butyracea TaxID=206335 RepID=A0A9P5P4G0_9AGAR|nr:hypothetical protein BDP27DRAFT_1349121 [Rhodocollybia butyracea]